LKARGVIIAATARSTNKYGLPMSTIEFKSETTGQLLLVATRLIDFIQPLTATYTLIHMIHGQVLVVFGAEPDVRAKIEAFAPA
jgi:hypothetical protein